MIELGSTAPYDGPDWAKEWIATASQAFDEYTVYKDEKATQTYSATMPELWPWIKSHGQDAGYFSFRYT